MQISFGLAREASKLKAIPTTQSSRRLISEARHNMRGSGDVSFALWALSLFAAWLFVGLPALYSPTHEGFLGVKLGEWLMIGATLALYIATRQLVIGAEKTAERQLRAYVKLPEEEHMAPEWQAAMEALILNATLGGPTMLAHVGVMRALNRNAESVFNPDRKDPHWGKNDW
jgi:hypothetical protein